VIVVDTNVLAYLLLDSPFTAAAERAWRKDQEWSAPRLWRSEFRNLLVPYLRRNEKDLAEAVALLEQAVRLLEDGERNPPTSSILALATTSGCTAYDCEFVALAESLGVPLVTCDRQVLRAFPGRAVSLEEFAATGGGGSATRGRARRP
jgi:predicted nucleic acid-binding protein